MPLSISSRLGRYEVIAPAGAGGMVEETLSGEVGELPA
jgi:hypothetical protein